MEELRKTGGARIGMANATWPLASLKVTRDKLELNAAIIGNFVFTPSDIVSIEPYTVIPIFGQGIKINHRVSSYSQKVIFWTIGSPTALIERIKQTGFLTNKGSINSQLIDEVKTYQSKGDFPIKLPAVIAVIVIWNILFLFDFQNFEGKRSSPLGIGAELALSFVLLLCVLMLTSAKVRRLLLKEGRTIDDIKRVIFFIMFICGFMLLGIAFRP